MAYACGNDSTHLAGPEAYIEDVRAQMFDSTGNKIGGEFTVNQYAEIEFQNFPSITSMLTEALSWYELTSPRW